MKLGCKLQLKHVSVLNGSKILMGMFSIINGFVYLSFSKEGILVFKRLISKNELGNCDWCIVNLIINRIKNKASE